VGTGFTLDEADPVIFRLGAAIGERDTMNNLGHDRVHSDERRDYRIVPAFSQLFHADLYDAPATYRAWLAMGLEGAVAHHLQEFASEVPNEAVVALVLDPSDVVGAEVWRSFASRSGPLLASWDHPEVGPHGPIMIIPCTAYCARRVLEAIESVVEYPLVNPHGGDWYLVVAAGGLSLFDAPVSAVGGTHREFSLPLNGEGDLPNERCS